MIYFVEIIKGVLFSLGFIIGLIASVSFAIAKIRSKEPKYKASDLIEPFKMYLKKLEDNEEYILVRDVVEIIHYLENKNQVIDKVRNFEIKKEIFFNIDSKGESSTFKPIENYKILGLKNQEKNK